MRNERVYNTALLKVSEKSPKELVLYFGRPLTALEKDAIEETVNYWLKSKAITGYQYLPTLKWEDGGYRLRVRGDFDGGYFEGNLTHRNAVGAGDEQFDIGLLKLIYHGREAKTSRGQDITRCKVQPLAIEFIYEEKEEWDRIWEKVCEFDTQMRLKRFKEGMRDVAEEMRKAVDEIEAILY